MELEREPTAEQKDIVYLQAELEKTHFDLYRNVSEQVLTDSLQKATEVEPEYFGIAIQESLALVRDAHTCVQGILNDNILPIALKEIDGYFYIIGSSKEYSHLLGQKLQNINGYKLIKLVEKISNLSSKENSETLKKDLAMDMVSNKVLKYYGFSSSENLQITTDKGTNEVIIDTQAKIKPLKPLRWKASEINDPTFIGNSIYRSRMVGDTLLFQYNSCTNEDHKEEELQNFKNNLLQFVKTSKTVIVDLRENRGGDTSVMGDLFEKFPDNKEIYVVMGRKTFSSAMHHMLYLKKKKNAILIGENAGQKPNRFGDNKKIKLPNSKININCSYKYFELLPGQNIDAIEPDIKIPVTIEDYMNETDPLNKWIKDNL
ncbi:MAG: hypothetical protein PHG60_02525 [Candidatus Dojkabacteria bacterium]|nr:hypothetical protein [Candidatus Dojkabacteria bacterium]